MSDTQDPFAARPYTPPSERNAEPTPDTASDASSENDPAGAPEVTEVEVPVEPVSEAPVVEPVVAPVVAPEVGPDAAEALTAETPVLPAEETAEPASSYAPPALPVPNSSTTHRFDASESSTTSEVSEPDVAAVPTASTYASEPDPRPASTIPASAVFPTETNSPPAPGYSPSAYVPPVESEFDKPSRGFGRKVAGALAIALIGGAAGVGGAAVYDEYLAPKSTTISALDQDADTSKAPAGQVEKVAASVLPSVVQIMVQGDDSAGSGTGIIISDDGEILTNNHVVEVAAGDDGKIVVVFSDGTNTSAKIVGQDPVTDIAVIKAAKVKGLTPATLGSNRTLQVGQTVVAVGSPFGLSSSVTAGIISALNRPVTEPGDDDDSSGTTFPGIQTDAAINPGNSGGPLVDLNGRVIGINSVIQSSGGGLFGGEAGSIGLGFAIPIDLAKSVAGQLLDGKKVEHAQIGVTVSAAVADNKLTTIGALVRDVNKGSAGDKAGLKSGDIITAVNNIPVARSEGLIAAIRAYEPGEKVTITYLRDDKKRTTEVTLGSDGGKTSQ
jgi:putative serine protease PepD